MQPNTPAQHLTQFPQPHIIQTLQILTIQITRIIIILTHTTIICAHIRIIITSIDGIDGARNTI